MTKGQEYLRLLRIEYQDLINIAKSEIAGYRYYMEHYLLTPEDIQTYLNQIRWNEFDIQQYSEALKLLGGVENAETRTESRGDSESPRRQFTGVNCTTVM
jgi:tRNA U38,U39,U40 pseudouridine synthase TruA